MLGAQVSPIPSNPEIDSAQLIALDAGHGEFFVCPAGARREALAIVFYADQVDQFFFCANPLHSAENGRWIEVISASRTRLRGPPYLIPASRRAVIEHTVSHLFAERQFLALGKPLSLADRPDQVVFSWAVRP